jgi:hypothetical protein
MTASLNTLVAAIRAANPRYVSSITPEEHEDLVEDLAPALVEAFAATSVRASVDATDNDNDDPLALPDAWGVTICVEFPEARDFGPVVLRYAVPEWQRGTCQAAHGGFDERMARVEWAEGAFYCAAFFVPPEVRDAIFDRVYATVEAVGCEVMRKRVAPQAEGGVA